MGDLLNLAKRDAKHFNNRAGFQEDIVITTPDNSATVVLTGFATKHHINFDSDGLPVNAKNAHVTIDESVLMAAGYPFRNLKSEISLLGHKVSFKDSSGTAKNYVIKEQIPDETLGLIVCVLGDFKV